MSPRSIWRTKVRETGWRIVRVVHHFDFKFLLPILAQLPLPLGYALAKLRAKLKAITCLDWRSIALGYRHIRQQCLAAYRLLPLVVPTNLRSQWRSQRFAAEAQEEFDASLVAKGRVQALACVFSPLETACATATNPRGLVLLTPHFDSFFLGAAFLGRAGGIINMMSSAITHDPRVDTAVQAHFESKYRGMEAYLNGGAIVNMEDGLRPFYRMLERNETLIVLADSPALPNGVSMDVEFLQRRRRLAGGPLRLAISTESDIGAYVCRHLGGARYAVELSTFGSATDPSSIEQAYQFMSQAILKQPGKWWGSDLLPSMPIVGDESEEAAKG